MSAHILYVDDDEANLRVFEASLRRHLPILTASSAAGALEVLGTSDVAVVLTDQRMPTMSGVELLAKVRGEWPEVIRMLITAYSDVEAAIAAINLGNAHLYLRKPWEPVALRLALEQARDRFLSARQVAELQRRLTQTERLYALGVVAASITHELRTPLAALQMSIEVLTGLLDAPIDEAAGAMLRETVRDAEISVRSMIETTQAMELSTRQQPTTSVNLREVVECAARSVRGEARLRCEIAMRLKGEPCVRGSRTSLGQVVLNLLVNALQAFDPELRARNLVEVSVSSEDGWALLTVEDNGPGMAPEVLARVFDPFFSTKVDGGTGLGLAISRKIVSELQGAIEVASAPGEGTRFLVRIPLIESSQ